LTILGQRARAGRGFCDRMSRRSFLTVGGMALGGLSLAEALRGEAAAATPRVIKEPRPVCHLTAFGEATIEYELRIWIEDPMNGVANVKSDCLLQLWDRFQANGIRIVARHLEVVLASPEGKSVTAKPLASRRA